MFSTLFTDAHRGSQLPSTAEIRVFIQPTPKQAAVTISWAKHNSLRAKEEEGTCIVAANRPRGEGPCSLAPLKPA